MRYGGRGRGRGRGRESEREIKERERERERERIELAFQKDILFASNIHWEKVRAAREGLYLITLTSVKRINNMRQQTETH